MGKHHLKYSLFRCNCNVFFLNSSKKVLLLLPLFLIFTIINPVFAEQPINDRIEIDDDDISADIAADDLFGYQIESIGDLDGDAVTDLAVTKFRDDSGETNAGSVLILFMNSDGSVKSTNEIVQDGTAGNIDSDCMAPDSTNRETTTLEQLAFIGDLDGDGEPTLAVGAADNEYGGVNTGAIYNLELNSDGTVDNCFLIIPNNGTHTSGFAPSNGVYQEGTGAFLGWPLIATDLNGDGQNELLAGATNEADDSTNLWPLFLNSTGGVSSHPVSPIFGIADIGIDSGDYIDDGDKVNNGTKIVVGAASGSTGEGSIFVINLTSAGAFSSSTEITGISLGQGIDSTDSFGSGTAYLGDMDNDGVDDILVGNIVGDDTNGNSGEAYILFMNSDDTVKDSQKISNLSVISSSTSTFLSATDLFGHGMSVWKEDGNDAVIAISAHQDDTGGGNAGALHLFYVTRNNSTFSSFSSSDAQSTTTLNDLSVSFSNSGTDNKIITLTQLSSNPESVSLPTTPVGQFYDITGSGTLNNIEITIQYTDAEITGIDESTLTIYRFTGGTWVPLIRTGFDPQNNSISAETDGFSTFSLGGKAIFSTSTGYGKQMDKNCKSNGFGPGKSLDIISIFVTKDFGPFRATSVDLQTSCGPASVRVTTEYGVKIAGLSYQQSEHDGEKTSPKLSYVTDIEGDARKIVIVAKDKRDVFVETIFLTAERFERYFNSTGYTSEQHSSTEPLLREPTTPVDEIVFNDEIPLWIKNDLSQWTGHSSRDHFFFDSISYLVDRGYIHYADWQKSSSLKQMKEYPEWVLDSVNLYTNEKITDDEFVDMIKFLIENRIIRIGR